MGVVQAWERWRADRQLEGQTDGRTLPSTLSPCFTVDNYRIMGSTGGLKNNIEPYKKFSLTPVPFAFLTQQSQLSERIIAKYLSLHIFTHSCPHWWFFGQNLIWHIMGSETRHSKNETLSTSKYIFGSFYWIWVFNRGSNRGWADIQRKALSPFVLGCGQRSKNGTSIFQHQFYHGNQNKSSSDL